MMAYDIRPKPVGDPNSSREGNPLLVGARAKQHQDYMTMETNGGLEADAQCCGENWLSQVHQRQQALTSLYSICNETVREEAFSTNSFCRLFSQENVLNLLFQLFDQKSTGQLIQSDFIESIQMKLGKDGTELVNLLDTLCYVFVNEADLDFHSFCRIWQSKGVLSKLFSIIDVDKSGKLPVTQLMAFINETTQQRMNRDIDILQPGHVEELFRSINKDNGRELTFDEFKTLLPCKNPFFAKRIFCIFDKDGSNTISMVEFREGLEQFLCQTEENKARCLFQIYDQSGTGLIQLEDLKAVLKACSEESGMKFSERQLDQLTRALYDDARDESKRRADNSKTQSGVSYEELREQMSKHHGLLDNLSIILERILLPESTPKVAKTQATSNSFSYYVKNKGSYIFFIIAYALVNIGLFISRAIQYKDSHIVYILARAAGQVLNFNCVFILVLMLRHCITMLRQIGCASFLPLDQHVYLHKMVGVCVTFFSILHTAMHLINFPLFIAGEMTSTFTDSKHSAIEWLFTTKPGMFGLIPGYANVTGWALVAILTIMVICSLPCVRKSGFFEVFYWTHLLYIPFWGLLIIHGPNFWKWFVGPGALFILIEGTRKLRFRWTGKGRSFISSAVLLPSRVTHLVVRKPVNFNADPGDYVFVKIPAIASNEWHPFTISSAPELQDYIWLHVRCAGGWTNKLYEYFELEQAKLCLQQKNSNTHDASEPICHHCKCVMDNTASSETQRIVKSVRRLTQKWIPPTKDDADALELLHLHSEIQDPNNSTKLLSSPVLDIPSISQLSPCPQYWTSLNQIQTPSPNRERTKEKNLQDNPEFGVRGRRDIYSYLRHRPGVMSIYVPEDDYPSGKDPQNTNSTTIKISPRASYAPESMPKKTNQGVYRQVEEEPERVESQNVTNKRSVHIYHPLEIAIDGPYGAPSSHIFRAQHAVLIAAGIGVTPFASILQSIMHRYYSNKHTCPKCKHSWGAEMPDSIMSLKKVDFFWINRDQRSFEWFVDLLSQLEMEQAEMGGVLNRFLDLHMYITSALKKTDMKAVGLQMALDLLHAKEKRDLVTGLKTRTNAGRPNWDKVFQKLADENKGKVTVFYCGPPQMAKELSKKCKDFGFKFCKEIF